VENYFKYQRNQRKSAYLVSLNIIVLFAMWSCLKHFLPNYINQNGVAEILEISNIVVPIVLLLLMLLAIYLWKNNKTFVIQITPTTLDVNDPMFSDYNWSVKLKDIQRIGYTKEAESKLRRVHVFLKDGSSRQLTQNYRYSRSRFYQALHKVAPHIDIEKSIMYFTNLK
jgi:hypothetical protein